MNKKSNDFDAFICQSSSSPLLYARTSRRKAFLILESIRALF